MSHNTHDGRILLGPNEVWSDTGKDNPSAEKMMLVWDGELSLSLRTGTYDDPFFNLTREETVRLRDYLNSMEL